MRKRLLRTLSKNKSFVTITEQLNTSTKKWKILGEGSYGRAYDMGDGRVCKITTNKREASVALKLMRSKKKYSYPYRILNVFTIQSHDTFKYGLIITPKYRKLTDNQKSELYELFCFLDLAPRFRLKSIEQIKKKIKRGVKDYYFARVPVIASSECAIIENVANKRIKTFNKYNILYILRNLKDAKLGPEDMHYDNILKDGDHFIFIDIGC